MTKLREPEKAKARRNGGRVNRPLFGCARAPCLQILGGRSAGVCRECLAVTPAHFVCCRDKGDVLQTVGRMEVDHGIHSPSPGRVCTITPLAMQLDSWAVTTDTVVISRCTFSGCRSAQARLGGTIQRFKDQLAASSGEHPSIYEPTSPTASASPSPSPSSPVSHSPSSPSHALSPPLATTSPPMRPRPFRELLQTPDLAMREPSLSSLFAALNTSPADVVVFTPGRPLISLQGVASPPPSVQLSAPINQTGVT